MASIVLEYKGLTSAVADITVDDTVSMATLLIQIASDEGLSDSYYNISLEKDPSITEATLGPISAHVVDGDRIICTPDQSGNKEARQTQKLDIAAVKRSDTYDITQLPTQYSGNDVVDNPNVGGLVDRRPWNTP